MSQSDKTIHLFIKIILVLIVNVLFGKSFLEIENKSNEIKISDSSNIATNSTKKETTTIFISEDANVYGAENIFIQTKNCQKKIKKNIAKLSSKKQYKSISKKKQIHTKVVIPQKKFHNTPQDCFFKNLLSANANLLNTSYHFKFLHIGNICLQKSLLFITKRNDQYYLDSKFRLTTLINLSDRAPPV